MRLDYHFQSLYKSIFGERGSLHVSGLTQRLASSLSPGKLQLLAQAFAAHRPISPWPGWKCDAVADANHPLTIFRQEIVALARANQWDFYITYCFQPGVKVRIRLTETVGRNLFVSGCKEPNEFAYINKLLKPGMAFLDLGANIGLYTVWAARRVGKNGAVIAVEPSTREFTRLVENVRLNRLSNVYLVNAAASNTRRTAELHISDENEPGQNTLGGFIYQGVQEVGIEHVSLDTVDDILQNLHIKHIDIVKMDIEEHEFFALQGMSSLLRPSRPILLTELSDETLQKQGCTSRQIFDFLGSFNYKAMVFSESTGLPVSVSQWETHMGNNVVFVPNN